MPGRALRKAALCLCAVWCSTFAGAATLELKDATLQGPGAEEFLPVRVVALPFSWDRVRQGVAGEALLDLTFRLTQIPAEPYALHFSRVGNRAEIWLNGVLLSRFGEPDAYYAKSPQYVLVPAQLLRQDNVLRVHLWADPGRRGGLAPVIVGPEKEVRRRYHQAYRWAVQGPLTVAAFSLLVGLTSLALWMTQVEAGPGGQPQRPRLYLWAGLSEILWSLRLVDVALIAPPLPWPYWGVLQVVAYAGWFCGAALFCHHVMGWHVHASMKWVRGVVAMVFVSSVPVAWLALAQVVPRMLLWWYGMVIVLFAGYALAYVVSALRQRRAEPLMAAAAGAFNVVVGMRDWWVLRPGDLSGELPWMRYSSLLFGLALFCIVIMRFRVASAQARDLMATLAARVWEKEQALAQSYRELEQMAREQERVAERGRILSDMHDGVGSHISAAIHQLQSGRAMDGELLQTLRDSLDHLKLSIDAMNLPAGDLNALLAGLRYRLEPRLRASGISLEWHVDLLEPLSWLDGRAMRHLQFMVFEGVSNVLQHARAQTLRIELQATPEGGAILGLIDDGLGFTVDRDPSRGLRTLRLRARSLGANLEVRSQPGRTEILLRLRPPAPAAMPAAG